MLITTLSCDAAILRCARCPTEITVVTSTTIGTCTCGGKLELVRACAQSLALNKDDGLLIRCVAENKEGWRCEDHGAKRRDFCAAHVHLADPARARPARELNEEILY